MSCPNCGAATAIADQRCRQCGTELNRPYAVSPAALAQTTPVGEIEVAYAGFWRRVGAFLIDAVLLWLVGQALGALLAQPFAMLGQGGRWIGFVMTGLYVIPAHHLWGQTLGKRLLAIRVQRLDGGPVSVSAATVRYLALAVPWFLNGVFFSGTGWPWVFLVLVGVILGSVLLIGILGNTYLLLFNRPSLRLIHDAIAGTVVVRASSERWATPSEGARIAPIHVTIVALIPLVVLGVLGWIALRGDITSTQIAELRRTQAALSGLPGVIQASLNDRRNVSSKTTSHVVSIGLWVVEPNGAKYAMLERQAVATVLEKYPRSRTVDALVVEVTYGFDIGIASLWHRRADIHSVADWRRMLGAGAGGDAR